MDGFITYTIIKVIMAILIMIVLASFIKSKAKTCGLRVKKVEKTTFIKNCLTFIKFAIFFCIPLLSEIGYVIMIFTIIGIWIMDEKAFKEYAYKVKIFEDIENKDVI